MREKATAARPPANSPAAAVVPGPGAPPTLPSVGQQLREVLPSRRIHSVSVCDHEANVLWLSEGALGPDENGLVVEALEILGGDPSIPCHEATLEDGRCALILPVRAPTGQLVGVTMILADCKSIGEDTQERLLAAPVRAIIQRLAVLLKPAAAPRSAATPELITPEQADDILEFELSSESVSVPARHTNGSKVHSTIDARSDMLRLEFLASEAAAASPAPPVAAAPPARRAAPAAQPPPSARREGVPPASEAAAAPQGDASLTLEVLPYAKLRPGGQSRRFQIQARFSPRVAQCDAAVLDALILQRLVAWLAAHRTVWNSQPTTFTVGVSIGTLEDDHFAQKVAAALNAHGIAAETLGFEIAEPLCTQHRAQAERFIAQCEKLGASVVIDDFSFDAQVLPLLRSKAVRLVKIDPKLSSSALKDKLAQALVIATVQAAKVLGIHCAARRVDSQAAAQWLGAVGCDFGQGSVFAPAKPLEALVASPDATGLTTLIDRRLNKSGNQ